MSHNSLRKEKDCLNCGALVDGRFCPACGQENVEPKQTLWHLLTHFFSDITHFDGKFFSTVKPLIFKPGFLSDEYVKGRRVKYLDPVRMYLFVSALFAIAYISFNKADTTIKETLEYKQKVDAIRDTLSGTRFNVILDSLQNGDEVTVFDTPPGWKITEQQYDSIQRSLPDSSKDGFVRRYLRKRAIEATHSYDINPYHIQQRVLSNFYHSFSKIFFFSLPIFASILYLVFIRRRKQFYYVSHAIFSIHYYCVILIFWGVFYMIIESLLPARLADASSFALGCIIPLALIIYLFIAMRRFYKQGWFKTFIKFMILGFLTGLVLMILVGGIVFKSLLDIGAG